MSYQINRFDGTPFITVQDGTLDSTTNIKLVGKNYAGYGEIQNENFLFLLENFSSANPPAKAISGQVWYDSGTKKLKFYDGTKFRTTGGAEVASTPPTGLTTGDFWFDTNTAQLKAWNGTDFTLIGPQGTPTGGKTQMVSELVKESGTTTTYPVIKAYVGDTVMAVFSKQAFIPDANYIDQTAFPAIKQGVTLKNALTTTGVSSGSNNFFWGTAADSNRLGGFPASSFVKTTDSVFSTSVAFGDTGFTVGDAPTPRLKVFIDGSAGPVIENLLGSTITMRITASGVPFNILRLDQDSAFPGQNEQYDLGKSSLKWDNVYAKTVIAATQGIHTGNVVGDLKGNINAADNTVAYNATSKTFFGTFSGTLVGSNASVTGVLDGTVTNSQKLGNKLPDVNATVDTVPIRNSSGAINASGFFGGPAEKADSLKISGTTYITASTSNTANTIAARDTSGDLSARFFIGTATSAQYADLAEKYLADAEYAPGTVIKVGGDKEVTATQNQADIAFGVVSTSPAYMMNSELVGGTYIALKGRVPVRVIGPVNKGNPLVGTVNGCATAALTSERFFAIALETDLSEGEKLLEAIIL
ncbi:hypothetical protein EBU71_01300 [bacterium]|nr:hypothetical protein [Candidatus Elulimicrobium humile]